MPAIAPSIVTDSKTVEFNTTDQSMWSTGQAITIDESWTLFSEGFSDNFSEFDGDLTVTANANISLVFDIQGDSGSISLDYPVNVSFDMPNVVSAGQQFTVQSTDNGLGSSSSYLSATFPDLMADLKAIFTAHFSLDFDSDLFGSDSTGYDYTDTIDIISVSSGETTTIEGISLYMPTAYDGSQTTEQVGTGPLAQVTLDVTTPYAATTGVNVLSVIEDIVGPEFPPLSGTFLDGDISYNLLTAYLDAQVAITQQFQFLPTGINLTLSAPWGESVTIPVGQSATFNVPYYWDSETTLTASYSLEGNLVNQTGFVGTASLDLTALSGYVEHLGSFGPLYTDSIPLYDSGPVYVFNPGGSGGFALDGFNTPTHALSIGFGSGALVAPGDFEIDGSGFTANDAALIQAAINSIATEAGATDTNLFSIDGSSGDQAVADAGMLNIEVISSSAISATMTDGFAAGFVWAGADGASLTGTGDTRVLAAAPKRGGSATLTAGGNELMVAGQQGQVTFNISNNFYGALAGLQAGDIINVAHVPAEYVYFDGNNLVFESLFFPRYEVAVSGDLANVNFDFDVTETGVTVSLVGPAPAPATEGDDVIAGSSGSETLDGAAGDDTIVGGGGADTINLGTGDDTLAGYWGDMNGDVVSGFSSNDRIDITGSLIGRGSFDVAVEAGMATLTAAGSSLQLNGDFTGGEFMAITRGTGANAHTVLTFENYLPSLKEGASVNPATINGIANEGFLTGDGSVSFTVNFVSSGSTYANTLGSYLVAEDGTISDVQILFNNTRDMRAGSVNLGVPDNNDRIGFFLIQDGFTKYGALPDNLSFLATGTNAAADLDDGVAPTLSSATLGALNGAVIFHSFGTLNPGDAIQVLSGVSQGGIELQIGFEDILSTSGDNDFQDVVFSVQVDNNDLQLLV